MGRPIRLRYDRSMSLPILVAALVSVLTLAAQQSTEQSSSWTVDANGHRVEGSNYKVVESPTGSQKVETQRSINGRMVPIQSSEDRVLQQDSSFKVIERTIRAFDANGNPGPPTKVRIEERKNPDGSSTIQSTAYRSDINGNSQIAERAVTQIRKGAATETTTTIERPTLNG